MAKAVITKKSPFYVQFYVSKYCHLKCRMCNIVEANSDVLPFESKEIEKIAENLVKIGAGVILLTGGEPFFRDDIDQIVKIFKKKKLDVRMQTSGLVPKLDKIKQCVDYGARDINVSLDSLSESKSDYINGVDGSWNNAIKSISFISNTFPERDSICALGCVLSSYNLDEIPAVLDFTTEIGWWLSLVPVHIASEDRPMNFRGYDTSFDIKKDDFDKLKSLISELKQKKKDGYLLFDSNEYLDSIVSFATTGTPTWRHKGICDSPNLYFAILPDGSFAPCCDFRMKNKLFLYDGSFPEIFYSKEFIKEVNSITSKCSGCNFGSFPEMTLSARSISTIKERLLLQVKAKNKGIKQISEVRIFEIIKNIKAKYPEIYKE